MQNVIPKGEFIVECRDKNGNLKWKDKFKNGVTDIGLNTLLNIAFGSTLKISTWYLGLIDSSGYNGINAGDTLASHGGWTEFTAYTVSGGSASNRGTWGTSNTSTKIITNASAVAFTITTGGTIKGFICCSDLAKATTGGTLWATALFASGDQTVVIGDVLNVTYSVSAGI
jgi:hypothetical protein